MNNTIILKDGSTARLISGTDSYYATLEGQIYSEKSKKYLKQTKYGKYAVVNLKYEGGYNINRKTLKEKKMNIRREEQPELNAYETFIELRRTIIIDDKEFDKEFMDDRAAPVATEEEFKTLRKSFEDWNNEGNNPQEYAYHHDDDLTDLFALEQLYVETPTHPLDESELY